MKKKLSEAEGKAPVYWYNAYIKPNHIKYNTLSESLYCNLSNH